MLKQVVFRILVVPVLKFALILRDVLFRQQ